MTAADPSIPAAFCGPDTGRIYLNGRRFADLPYVMNADSKASPMWFTTTPPADVAMHGSSVHAAPLVEQIAEVMAEHLLYGEWDFDDALECGCGTSWTVADFDESPQMDRVHLAHVASQLARLVEREKHNAWQQGYDAGETCALDALSDDHTCARNPYADGDE